MGLFDTLILREPFYCTNCANPINDVQTKHFACALEDLKVGSLVEDDGIYSEMIYCPKCRKEEKNHRVYVVVYDNVILYIGTDQEEAGLIWQVAVHKNYHMVRQVAKEQAKEIEKYWKKYRRLASWLQNLKSRLEGREPSIFNNLHDINTENTQALAESIGKILDEVTHDS